jgi:Rps23 Pro-64 3,4-dihydroxylase Tpa1-like proline 4-hydroxylase
MMRERYRSELVEHASAALSENSVNVFTLNRDRECSFRYIIVDNFLPKNIHNDLLSEVDLLEGRGWKKRSSFRESKWNFDTNILSAGAVEDTLELLSNPAIVSRAEDLFGIEELIPDKSLYAGGISLMKSGDFLYPHVDNSHDSSKSLYRRINALYYPLASREVGAGGDLTLWDNAVRNYVTIETKANRLVLMETNRFSWHSVSEVKANNFDRYCISTYYFSKNSPQGYEYSHITEFMSPPDRKIARIVNLVDNAARTLSFKIYGHGRGHKFVRNRHE